MADPPVVADESDPEHSLFDFAHILDEAVEKDEDWSGSSDDNNVEHDTTELLAVRNFQLHDSMAATQLMDPIMDSCEVSIRHYRRDISSSQKRVFPRPAPLSISDVSLGAVPWPLLSLEGAAATALQIVVRFQALTSGASVEESIFTCLYAHLLPDMIRDLHAPDANDLEEHLQALSLDNGNQQQTGDTTAVAQWSVLATTVGLLQLTQMFRNTVLNADIYEEEDFVNAETPVVLAAHLEVVRTPDQAVVILQRARALLQPHARGDTDNTSTSSTANTAARILTKVLDMQLHWMDFLSSLARIPSDSVRLVAIELKPAVKTAVGNLKELAELVEQSEEVSKWTDDLVDQFAFDSFINRPLLGNTPVRNVCFRSVPEALERLIQVTAELDVIGELLLLPRRETGSWATLERRLQRLPHCSLEGKDGSTAGNNHLNIITRSLIVLNLYFDDKILGQNPIGNLLVQHLVRYGPVPAAVVRHPHTLAFVNRLAKPLYDVLKLSLLNRNRRRTYIEAVMLPDWASLQQEAHMLDALVTNESSSSSENGETSSNSNNMKPYISQHVLQWILYIEDEYLASGLAVGLFVYHEDVAYTYWYRDFLLSALVKNWSGMMAAAVATSPAGPAAEQAAEDDFYKAYMTLKRTLCRGILRLVVSLRQASLLTDSKQKYEFTSSATIFAKRMQALRHVRQPPVLSFDDYLEGSDYRNVSAEELLNSTKEWLDTAKKTAQSLLTQISYHNERDPDPEEGGFLQRIPTSEAELRSLMKVCIGNSVYLLKLQQYLAAVKETNGAPPPKPRIDFDFDTHPEFCTVKVEV